MKTTAAKVMAKAVSRGGKHMGHPGKTATIKPSHFKNKPVGKKTMPC